MFIALVVFLFVFSLPLPGAVMYTTWVATSPRWRNIATIWLTAMAYAIAIAVQVYAIVYTHSGLIMAVAAMSFFFNLLALQGIGEEKEE